jgi:hypothetical protein
MNGKHPFTEKTLEACLHREDESKCNKRGVGSVDFEIATAHDHEDEHVKRDEVDDKHVASPSRHLVKYQVLSWVRVGRDGVREPLWLSM